MSSADIEPLLPTIGPVSAPAARAFRLPMPAHREWKGHLLACFGSGDQLGLSSCSYVYLLRPFAWGYAEHVILITILLEQAFALARLGHNMQRAFNRSFWKHTLLFMLLISTATCMIWLASFWKFLVCTVGPFHIEGDNRLPTDPTAAVEDQKVCEDATRSTNVFEFAAYVLFLCGVLYTVKARTAMRAKFGIQGSIYKDVAARLFCGACADCQETRTLAHNNVQKGVWYGETVLEMPDAQELYLAAQQPPAPMAIKA